MPLQDNDIKSELSYTYLHAVAARAGCECHVAGRHSDNQGIDAVVVGPGDFGPGALTRVTILFQLKATSQRPKERQGRLAYDLDVGQYEKLRTTTSDCPFLLLLFQLPSRPRDWWTCSPRMLTLTRCAHWVSLYGAAPSSNQKTQRVFLPKKNHCSVPALQELLRRFASEEAIPYES
jgi:hypothetical protein